MDGTETLREPIRLSKGAHSWVFVCERGRERELIETLAELAEREDCPLDWFDAALVMNELDEPQKAAWRADE
ncbi:MAG: hypothetical protein IT439_08145 [Phycisphaerales bacterium]|nr:hypothetical protein [Phycisphaerales bacterium]